MSRPLTPSEAAAALRRGQPVEQFLTLQDGRLTWLTASPMRGKFALSRHVVHDQGSEDFRDITEFAPVDEDEHIGEGVTVAESEDPVDAIEAANDHGGSSESWVNFGVAATDYWAVRQEGQSR